MSGPSSETDGTPKQEEQVALEETQQAPQFNVADVLESISDAFYAVDHNWCLTYVNRHAERIWGMRREALLGKNLWEVFPQSVDGTIYEALYHAAREQQAVERELFSEVMGHWLAVNIYPSSVGLSVYFHDITGKKQAEQERYWLLREAQSRAAELAAVIESIPDALFIGNSALVSLANPAALDLLGCASVENLNRDLPALLERARARDASTGEAVPPDRWPLNLSLGGKQRVQDLVVHHARLGRDLLLRCAASPIRVKDEDIGVISVNSNLMRSRQQHLIRGLIQAQEEERRAVAYELHDGLTQYVWASHAHLQTFQQQWEEGRGDRAGSELGQGLEYLRQAVAESRRLINGLRALALDDLGLAGALEELLSEEKARAGWREAELVHNVTGRRFEKVLETTIFRVVQEALTNARKHARASYVRLLLQADLDERSGKPVLTLEVRDQGCGFVPEETTAEYGHLGLQGMVERVNLLGGSYHLQSAPGEGTIIRAVFPARAPRSKRGEEAR